jgi:hypothetical protein
MPKGIYDLNKATDWSPEEDEWLRQQCETTASYAMMAAAFVQTFKFKRTRNAILGRAARRGYAVNKPGYQNRLKGVPKAGSKGLRKYDKMVRVQKKAALAPVVFKDRDPKGLRSDAEPILRRSHPHMVRRATPEEIAERQKGELPCIIEAEPLTSVPFMQADGCKWPTTEDPRDLHVCGAEREIGAYCTRHARVAYREMPTPRRNRGYTGRGLLETTRKIVDEQVKEFLGGDDDELVMIEHLVGEIT